MTIDQKILWNQRLVRIEKKNILKIEYSWDLKKEKYLEMAIYLKEKIK